MTRREAAYATGNSVSRRLYPSARGSGVITDLQHQILELVAAGQTDQEIADKLHYSYGKVKDEVRVLLWNLGANCRANLVHEGWRQGFFTWRKRDAPKARVGSTAVGPGRA